MEESSMSSNVNFIKLNIEELSSKIALLVSEKFTVNFWKKYPTHYQAQVIDYDVNTKVISLKTNNFYLEVQNESLMINFNLRNLPYFFKGKVIEHNKSESIIKIKIEGFVFRGEKRKQERLITFPVYQIFTYFRYKAVMPSNVLSFNKKDEKINDFLFQIENQNKENFFNDEEEDCELLGFRVDNLSANGMSFFASAIELEKLNEIAVNRNFDLILNFEGTTFNIKNCKIVYSVDYISKTMVKGPMFRVGIQFDYLNELQKLIEERTGETLQLEDFQKEFEEFVKNE